MTTKEKDWIKLVQFASNWIRLDRIETHWKKLDEIGDHPILRQPSAKGLDGWGQKICNFC